MNKVEPVEHEGHKYEIRATASEPGWRVQSFSGGKAVSPPYTANWEVATDIMSKWKVQVADCLIEIARDDIISNRLVEVASTIETA